MSIDKLKQRIFGKKSSSVITSFFYLIKDLGVADLIIGKDYEGIIHYKGEDIKFEIRQKPMNISQMNILLDELNKHYLREKRASKKR